VSMPQLAAAVQPVAPASLPQLAAAE
jgi:hypothetical protein